MKGDSSKKIALDSLVNYQSEAYRYLSKSNSYDIHLNKTSKDVTNQVD